MVYTFGAVFGEQSNFVIRKALKYISSVLLGVIVIVAKGQVVITEKANISERGQPPYILNLPCKVSRKVRVTVAVYTDYRTVNKKIAALRLQLHTERGLLAFPRRGALYWQVRACALDAQCSKWQFSFLLPVYIFVKVVVFSNCAHNLV